MLFLVVVQDIESRAYGFDRHETCALSKSFNRWAQTSFGPGVAELDGNNLTFTLTRPTRENSSVDRLKRILSEQLHFRYRAVNKQPSLSDEMGSMLELDSYERRHLGEKSRRTLALLFLGGCLYILGCQKFKPSIQIANKVEQLLRRKSQFISIVLFATGLTLLTFMQLRVCKFECAKAQASGNYIGAIKFGREMLTTCTLDGSRWGLPRLITVFGVDESQADRIHSQLLLETNRSAHVIAISNPYQQEDPSFISSLWTEVAHPTVRSLDVVSLFYGFLSPLLPMLWYRRRWLDLQPVVKSSLPCNQEQEQKQEVGSPVQSVVLSMPKAGFVEMVEIQLGPGLTSLSGLIDFAQERSRLHLLAELGIEIPRVSVGGIQNLADTFYSIRVREVEFATGQLFMNQWLAIGSQSYLDQLAGRPAENSILDLPGKWIDGELVGRAKEFGCLVLLPRQILMMHLELVIRAQAWQFMGHQETYDLLETLGETHHRLVRDVSNRFEVSVVKQVLQQLLREQVSVRDLPLILETMLDSSCEHSDVLGLSEAARKSLSYSMCRGLLAADGTLKVITLDPSQEAALKQQAPSVIGDFLQSLGAALDEWSQTTPPILLTSSEMRRATREIVCRSHPDLPVFAWDEIPSGVKVEGVSMLSC